MIFGTAYLNHIPAIALSISATSVENYASTALLVSSENHSMLRMELERRRKKYLKMNGQRKSLGKSTELQT